MCPEGCIAQDVFTGARLAVRAVMSLGVNAAVRLVLTEV